MDSTSGAPQIRISQMAGNAPRIQVKHDQSEQGRTFVAMPASPKQNPSDCCKVQVTAGEEKKTYYVAKDCFKEMHIPEDSTLVITGEYDVDHSALKISKVECQGGKSIELQISTPEERPGKDAVKASKGPVGTSKRPGRARFLKDVGSRLSKGISKFTERHTSKKETSSKMSVKADPNREVPQKSPIPRKTKPPTSPPPPLPPQQAKKTVRFQIPSEPSQQEPENVRQTSEKPAQVQKKARPAPKKPQRPVPGTGTPRDEAMKEWNRIISDVNRGNGLSKKHFNLFHNNFTVPYRKQVSQNPNARSEVAESLIERAEFSHKMHQKVNEWEKRINSSYEGEGLSQEEFLQFKKDFIIDYRNATLSNKSLHITNARVLMRKAHLSRAKAAGRHKPAQEAYFRTMFNEISPKLKRTRERKNIAPKEKARIRAYIANQRKFVTLLDKNLFPHEVQKLNSMLNELESIAGTQKRRT